MKRHPATPYTDSGRSPAAYFDFLGSDDTRHLTLFFSNKMLSVYFAALWLCGLSLVVAWPKRPLFDYLETGSPPVCFSGCLIAGALILSYISLRCGRGELAAVPVRERRKEDISYLEESRNFLSYGLISFTLHTILLIFLLLPVFLIALSISGGTFGQLSYALLTIFLTALLVRCFGFFAHLAMGRWNNACYLFTRVAYFVFFFITTKFHPHVNPLQTLHGLAMGRHMDQPLWSGPYADYYTLVTTALVFLILANHLILVQQQRARSKEASP